MHENKIEVHQMYNAPLQFISKFYYLQAVFCKVWQRIPGKHSEKKIFLEHKNTAVKIVIRGKEDI